MYHIERGPKVRSEGTAWALQLHARGAAPRSALYVYCIYIHDCLEAPAMMVMHAIDPPAIVQMGDARVLVRNS